MLCCTPLPPCNLPLVSVCLTSLVDPPIIARLHKVAYEPLEASDTERGEHVTLIYVTAFYYALATFCSVGYGGLVYSRNEFELR